MSLLLLAVLAACGADDAPTGEPAADTAAAEAPMADSQDADPVDEDMAADDDMADDDMTGAEHDDGDMDEMADESMDEEMEMAEAPAGAPAWFTMPLTNARSGESFTLADFAGKTVFVEPMATWCTNCLRQLTDVKVAQANLDPDEVVIIGLSVETTLSGADLAQYADRQDFNWTWVVATPDLLRSLVDTFGQTVTNAPSTPHFIVRPDGSFTDLDTGFESPDELIAQITEAQG
jgi:peroxiredoxin